MGGIITMIFRWWQPSVTVVVLIYNQTFTTQNLTVMYQEDSEPTTCFLLVKLTQIALAAKPATYSSSMRTCIIYTYHLTSKLDHQVHKALESIFVSKALQ